MRAVNSRDRYICHRGMPNTASFFSRTCLTSTRALARSAQGTASTMPTMAEYSMV